MPTATTSSAELIRAMLLRNRYLSALPARLLINDTRSGRIIALPMRDPNASFGATLTQRSQVARLPAFDAFVAALEAVG